MTKKKAEEAQATNGKPEEHAVEPAVIQGAAETVKITLKGEVEKAIKEAVAEAKGTVRGAIQEAMEEAKESAVDEHTEDEHEFHDKPKEALPHAFVVMPFGQKKGFDGTVIDFNAIYNDLIKPALEEAGFEPFRADEETVSGDILTDMFQELLLADLVLCDMSIDNANVFYEIGVRHAFRRRGIVHISAGRAYMPFDVFNVRTIPYQTNDEGVPDPASLEKDIQAIARVARDTWASDQDAIHSPIFNLLTGLDEPDRKTLRTPLATGFWREYNEWKERVTIAQRQKRIGDILLLTEEISNPLIKEEAVGQAGQALRGMGRHALALQQYRKGLEINSKNMEFRRQEAFHLNRLGRVDEAIVKLENLLEDVPNDTEAIAALGRIYKDMWTESWTYIDDAEKRLEEAFDAYHWLIKSIDTYLKGYQIDLNNTYPGVNALTLSTILLHLANLFDDKEDPDPEIEAMRTMLPALKSTLQFALEKLAKKEKIDYWTLVSLAELLVTTSEHPRRVERAYRKALTAARKNIFYLQSSVYQLDMLKSLNMRPEFIEAGNEILKDEIQRIKKDEAAAVKDDTPTEITTDEQAFLFAGHMLDKPNQLIDRFPADMETEVREHMNQILDKFEADGNDYAFIPGAACGGDIVFIEACLERGLRVEIHLPFAEAPYIKKFISSGGDQWIERFYALRNHPNIRIRLQAERVGKAKPGDNVLERNNRWTLYSSLILGISKVRLIALWDGISGQGSDLDGQLVSNMVAQMRQMGGIVEHLNTTKFDYWEDHSDRLVGLFSDS